MSTDRDRLTKFLYLLTRSAQGYHATIDVNSPLDPALTDPAVGVAREMVAVLLGPDEPEQRPAQPDTLRAAAKLLARLRGMVMSPVIAEEINAMIDRINLASMGVPYEADQRIETPAVAASRLLACRYMLADACGGALNSHDENGYAPDGPWDLARYCEHVRDEQISIVSQLGEIFGDDAEHLGQPYGDSFAAVKDALGRMRRVADEDVPEAVLVANGWTDIGKGGWYHSVDGTAVDTSGGSIRVTGGRDLTPAEMRAFAEMADGQVAPVQAVEVGSQVVVLRQTDPTAPPVGYRSVVLRIAPNPDTLGQTVEIAWKAERNLGGWWMRADDIKAEPATHAHGASVTSDSLTIEGGRVLAVGAAHVMDWINNGGSQDPGRKVVLCDMPAVASVKEGGVAVHSLSPGVLAAHGWTCEAGSSNCRPATFWTLTDEDGDEQSTVVISDGKVSGFDGFHCHSPEVLIAFATLAKEPQP